MAYVMLIALLIGRAVLDEQYMRRIETLIRRSNLGKFCRCAGRLGILGFDLAENTKAVLRADFVVGDQEVKDTVHAVLEEASPDSIAVFKLDAYAPVARP
jgi:hypothetical protein